MQKMTGIFFSKQDSLNHHILLLSWQYLRVRNGKNSSDVKFTTARWRHSLHRRGLTTTIKFAIHARPEKKINLHETKNSEQSMISFYRGPDSWSPLGFIFFSGVVARVDVLDEVHLHLLGQVRDVELRGRDRGWHLGRDGVRTHLDGRLQALAYSLHQGAFRCHQIVYGIGCK